ncbi:MAG: glycosyltransferase family 4 protein [Beduini sp.]|uniref:glycosyltransferase family 4 protein n=1 Tax=Beduini sp. TaxID=1922300 RepID=UPI0011C94FF8
MKKILILANFDDFYNTRKEVVEELVKSYEVNICYPYGLNVEKFKEMGAKYTDITIDRRGKNPIQDIKLFIHYFNIIKKYKPDCVLSYSIKPNIYGGLACRIIKIPYLVNITGLGSALENSGWLQKLTIALHKIALKKAHTIFVQNKENKKFFQRHNINVDALVLIPGSGVNTDDYVYLEYPKTKEKHFLYIARVMKEKGIDQYLEAAAIIKRKYKDTYFHILGFCEEDYKDILKQYQDKNYILYHGLVEDVKKYHKMSCCLIHPSYYPEGMSNVLLEACACGRPVITTNRSGCKEIVDDGKNGYIFQQCNTNDLVEKIEKFLRLSVEEQMQMGVKSRNKVKLEFNRSIIIKQYKIKIKEVLNEE